MTQVNFKTYFVISVLLLSSSGIMQNDAFGDSTSTFGILASTYTSTASGTVITGDLGYTKGPAVVPIVSGSTHVADSAYSKAGTAQNTATAVANSQACTANLGTTVNLSLINGGVYTPGVYCTTGAASIGTAGITLSGNGIYIFKIDGALTTVVNSDVNLTNGAQASQISWVPTQATTLGANSNFAGTILDASGVTIGGNTSIVGRVLSFGGTVSTGPSVMITVPSFSMADAISGNFAILSSTYSNIKSGTTITGDLGYTTKPAMAATVNGDIHVADVVYSKAGTAQNTATAVANSQACTANLGNVVNLSLINGGVYTPGVYCTTGAASIGTNGITLSGNGIYIFKIDGALTTAAASDVNLTNGAQASQISWVPTGATTLGANSNFAGTILDAPGVTIGNGASVIGRVLSFGGTVTTGQYVTVTVPSYAMADAISDNSQCTFSFPKGAIDLGSNVQYPAKVYPPGVYCIDGAANIGSGPITLTGNGVHKFIIDGTLKQAVNTSVLLADNARASDVYWVPTGAVTIGANSHLIGTVIGAPITIGANSDINGVGPSNVMADAISGNFAILSSTYSNIKSGTTITGDLGYTTKPAMAATVNGDIHVADAVYSKAGTAQNTATAVANSQVCTANLGTTVNLSMVNNGVYTPGVYCTTGAASIGNSGITLTGNGIYIFKIDGALTTAAASNVMLTNGAQASNVSWVPTGAATLGANSNFAGTILDAPGVTIGNGASVIGRVLSFGGTVTTGQYVTVTVPSYAMADAISGNFAVLSSTYTNTASGTSITGDLGYTTKPAMAATVNGDIHVADSAYSQAGIAQKSATSSANAQVCTANLGTTVNLSLINGGVYTPGVYCTTGAASIGSTGITLSGNGIYIFKINGALTTVANSDVRLTNGAQASSISWVPTAAVTLGANSNFAGTILDAAGVTISKNVSVTGRVLAFGGTVTTGPSVTITIPSYTMADAISSNFGVLASTYTNTKSGTSITGDLGYITKPAMAATVNGVIHVADSAYSQAGIAQNAATKTANAQVCTTNLGTTVNLSMVNGGVYTPGVYCTTGAASIGTNGITLSGNGIYIFKIDGALTTVANSDVRLTNGAQASQISWVPTAAVTLGANSNFAGTILDAAGVTIGNGASVTGRVLAFGGTVTTGPSVMITVPSYSMADAISINSQCTFSFPPGAIDLGSNVQYPDKVYPPGVYCIDGALNIGSGPITLTGNGAHIFKINGAFGQVANSDVILSDGAKVSGVFWMPTGATTIGANSHLIGIVIGAPIIIGANSDINGISPKIMADAIPINSQCTFSFPPGAIDLGSNVQYPAKVYPPGVYCIDGALNIGSGPITLTGNGAHIFKINGAFGQVANSDVILSDGAQASSVIWVPTGTTTIGANSHLIGTVNGAPIIIGANSDINGVGPAKIMADAISDNSQCTFSFPPGAIDLGSNVQYPAKVYPPGVYCIDGALNIGSGPITLTGNGAHIFKINGAFGQVANSDVILSDGAQASSVIWVPTGTTTIGANSHLIGTVNGAPIIIGANSYINGVGPKMMADAIFDSQCTFSFPPGAIDLGSNVQYPDKVYPPGVYCIDGALNIGSGPITLTGNGAHAFIINGNFDQTANTDVILSNGAQASDVHWVPTGTTTIGANSHLIGDVHGAPVIIGANSDINGVGPAKIMADVVKVIPEFGTIAVMILLVSIVSVIAISAKSRLSIMPRY